jgi:hypothetical protein
MPRNFQKRESVTGGVFSQYFINVFVKHVVNVQFNCMCAFQANIMGQIRTMRKLWCELGTVRMWCADMNGDGPG